MSGSSTLDRRGGGARAATLLAGSVVFAGLAALAMVDRTAGVLANPVELALALGYLVFQAGLGLRGLDAVEREAVDETATLLAAVDEAGATDAPPWQRALVSQRIEASYAAVHGEAAGVANQLVLVGMIGSALFLLASVPSLTESGSAAAHFLLIAPKAFAATGLGVLCGSLVARRGEALANRMRRLAHVRLEALALEHRAPDIDGSGADATELQRELVRLVAGIRDLVGGGRDQTPLQAVGAALGTLAEQQRRTVDALEVLHSAEAFAGMMQRQQELRSAVDGVRGALTTEAVGLLEQHVARLASASEGIVKDVVERIATRAVANVESRLDELAGRYEQSVSEIYQRAFHQAADQLRARLGEMLRDADGLGESLRKVRAALGEVALAMDGTSAVLQRGAESTAVSTQHMEQTVVRAIRAAQALQRAIDALEAAGGERAGGIATDLARASHVLAETSQHLAHHVDVLEAQQERMGEARTRLANLLTRAGSAGEG